MATQAQATQNGAPGSRVNTAAIAPNSPSASASTAAKASHGSGPTYTPIHGSSGTKNPRPAR